MNKMILGAAAAAMAVVAAAPAYAATEEVFNENFETGFGKFTPTGNVTRVKGVAYTTNGNVFTGSEAAQANTYASFGAGSGRGTPVGGTLLAATIQGTANVLTRYTVTFAAGVIGSTADDQFLNFSATSTAGELLNENIKLINSTNLDNALRSYTFSFDTRGPISFNFFGEGVRNDGADTLLDNIVVTSTTGVPEMSTWGMMIVGFGIVGGTVRTRRRKTLIAA